MMPDKLRKDFKALKSEEPPKELDMIEMYIEQLQHCLPED